MLLTERDELQALIKMALSEDLRAGDITSQATIPAETQAKARLVAKERLVICGQEVAHAVFRFVDASVSYRPLSDDGVVVEPGTVIAEVCGPARALLAAERTALNFLQHLSAIATKTSSIVSLVAQTSVRILDTRKTTPGWRMLEKYAVRTGGGSNHRIGLFDAFLIKDNHIDALGGDIAETIRRCRAASVEAKFLEVEVRTMEELKCALAEEPDIILLDNMSPTQMRDAVDVVRGSGKAIALEASGGITESNVRAYAETGVDFISLGALTHSIRAADISMKFVKDAS